MNNSLDTYRKSLWPLPQHTKTSDGKMRRLGVEIEFTGMEINDIADTIISLYGVRQRQFLTTKSMLSIPP